MDDAAATTLTRRDSDETALLARLRQGDDTAFESLVREQSPRMLVTARRILGNEDDARDAVQDGFLSAFRALSSFEGQSRLSTWLHRIVLNAALGKLRQRRRKDERSIDALLPRYLDDGHQAEPAAQWQEPADSAMQRRETCDWVRHAVDQLPEMYRAVLLLRDIEEVGTDETATMLGISAASVKTRLHRARQALRTLIDPHLQAGAL